MSAAAELLAEVRRQGIELQAHSDRLRFRPVSAVTPELHDQLARHKPELLALLRPGRPPERPACPQNRPTTSAPEQPGRVDRPPTPAGFLDKPLSFGDVADGWTPAGWAAELRRKAHRCDLYRSDVAEYYRAWALYLDRQPAANVQKNEKGLA